MSSYLGGGWEGIPPELKILCMLEKNFNEVQLECVQPALRFLYNHFYGRGATYPKATDKELFRWMETGFDACLFPIDSYWGMWYENDELIYKILTKAEHLLLKQKEDIFDESYLAQIDETPYADLYNFSQKLNKYFCVYFGFKRDMLMIKNRVSMALEDTKRNSGHLFENDFEAKWNNAEPLTRYLFFRPSATDTLSWLVREYPPGVELEIMLSSAYEAYALYLVDLEHVLKVDQEDFAYSKCVEFQADAEKQLRKMCRRTVEDIIQAAKEGKDPDGHLGRYMDNILEMEASSYLRMPDDFDGWSI